MRIKYSPLRGIPIEIECEEKVVKGEIVYLYPNDIEVKMTSPLGGPVKGLHVPHFKMYPSMWLAEVEGDRTVQISRRGRDVAEQLLKELYETIQQHRV